jgi:O-antigen ligase
VQSDALFPAQPLLVVMLAAPWLWPVAVGPTPALLPWLFSIACAAIVVLLSAWCAVRLSRAALAAWVLAAVLSSLIGLVQYAGASAAWVPLVNSTPLGEAFGNLRQRNQFATLTNIGLVSVMAWLAMAPRPGAAAAPFARPANGHTAAVLVLVMLMAVANAASSSRTGLLQLATVVLMGVVWAPWRRPAVRTALLAALVAYGVAAFALPRLAGLDPWSSGIVSRLQDGAPACLSRLTLWSNVLHLITERPWTGWGWGALDQAHFMAVYPGPRFCDILDNAHNLPLHLAVELGIPVAVLVCGLLAAWVWRSQPWRETQVVRQLAWAVLALVAVHSLLEYPLWYGPFQIASGLALGLLWTTRAQAPAGAIAEAPVVAPTSGARVVATALALLVLVATAYTAWDYRRVSQIYMAPASRAPGYRTQTLEKLQASWLFARQVQFAELTMARLTPENAAYFNAMAHRLLRFSPEPRVVEKIIDSALLLGRADEAQLYLARLEAAYPAAYAARIRARAQP